MMETFRFQFNTEYARSLRDAVNDRRKQSIDNMHAEKQIKGPYCAWDRTCAAMDRLEDTLDYLNDVELGKDKKSRSAFDFYDFINNAYIVIDCIKTIGRIFRVDNQLIEEIENSTSIFKNELGDKSTDQKYFEYVRSLCSVHPLCTNHQKEFLNSSQFHCCPFVSWQGPTTLYHNKKVDLMAFIYPSDPHEKIIQLGLYVSQFEQYLAKWIDFIPKIIEAKNTWAKPGQDRGRRVDLVLRLRPHDRRCRVPTKQGQVQGCHRPGAAAGCRCALLSDPPVIQARGDHAGGGQPHRL